MALCRFWICKMKWFFRIWVGHGMLKDFKFKLADKNGFKEEGHIGTDYEHATDPRVRKKIDDIRGLRPHGMV